GASPVMLHHSEHTCRNLPFRSARALHRLGSATVDRCQTSRPAVPSCRHSQPCPPDPASLPHRVRDCKAPLPEPGRRALRGGPTTCLGKLSCASYPLFINPPPHLM